MIPQGWLKLALNPLQGRGRLSRYGVAWFAELLLVDHLPNKKETFGAALDHMESEFDQFLRKSTLLEGLDPDDPTQSDRIFDALQAHKGSVEWWSYFSAMFLSWSRDAIESGNAEEAAWAMACSERFRSMLVFKRDLEEVVWMGHSAARIVEPLRIWEHNKTNGNEAFWHETFAENTYAISQVFAVPLVIIEDNAYVGGMNVSRKSARIADYLFATESSREAVIVEIKTPITKLLGSRYRGILRPSAELQGAVIQALDYRATLAKDLESITRGSDHQLRTLDTRCVVIAGNGAVDLDSGEKRSNFEYFRSNSRHVEVVTYDELFRKLELLAQVFNLVRNVPSPESTN